jgi:hypothetical protein
MNKFPALALTVEEFGYAQVEGDRIWSAAQVSSGALETNPAGQAIACRHVQDLNHSRLTIGQAGATSLPGAHREREC